MKKKKKQEIKEPEMIHCWDEAALEIILKKLHNFKYQEQEEASSNNATLEIYDNGDLFLNGDFEYNYKEPFNF